MNRRRNESEKIIEDNNEKLELTPKIKHMVKIFEHEEKLKEGMKVISKEYVLNEKGKILLKSKKANGNVVSEYMGSLSSTPDLYKKLKSEGKI